MDLQLKNKIILITGSSKGIGKFIAKNLSNQGALVVLNSRNKKDLESTSKEIKNSFYLKGDVSQTSECNIIIKEIIDRFGKLDALVCNVGSGKSVPPGNENYEEWKKSFDINFFSATNIIEASKSHLAKSKGAIVCISSICGVESISSAPVTYSVAKSALNSYVSAISKPLAKEKIRINAIAPGNILFDGSTWDYKNKENAENVKAMLNEKVPLKMFGDPDHIANLVAYLISPLSDFCTGSIWKIDGGQTNSF